MKRFGTLSSKSSTYILCQQNQKSKAASVGTLCIISATDAQRYRKDAQECREQAEKAISQLDKEAWLRLAADWIKLARKLPRKGHRF
jgi:hypothetical protein